MSDILIIAEHRQGALRPVTLEVLGAATSLAAEFGGSIHLALIGRNTENFIPDVSVGGVTRIHRIEVEDDTFDPEVYSSVLSDLLARIEPGLVLLPHSVDSMSYAATVAARHGTGFATDVFALHLEGGELVATRSGYGQKVHVEVDFPGKETVLLTLRPNTFKAPVTAAFPEVVAAGAPAVSPRSRHLEYLEPQSEDTVNIPGAEFILSIGRGVADEDNVEEFVELADMVGATLGCSRPIADAGWLPKARQVGQSGKTASNCRLYVALGISGSVQHLAGMKHVENIIAVNADSGASIFNYARYGVVGDMFEVAEELRHQLGE